MLPMNTVTCIPHGTWFSLPGVCTSAVNDAAQLKAHTGFSCMDLAWSFLKAVTMSSCFVYETLRIDNIFCVCIFVMNIST